MSKDSKAPKWFVDFAVQINKRLDLIEKRLDSIEQRLSNIENTPTMKKELQLQ